MIQVKFNKGQNDANQIHKNMWKHFPNHIFLKNNLHPMFLCKRDLFKNILRHMTLSKRGTFKN